MNEVFEKLDEILEKKEKEKKKIKENENENIHKYSRIYKKDSDITARGGKNENKSNLRDGET